MRASIPDSIRRNNQLVIVGRIRRPHGIRGEVMVESMTDVDDRFAAGSRMRGVVSRDVRPDSFVDLTVADCRSHSGALLVAFEGVADRQEAETLRDAWLVVDRGSVGAAPPGGHYFFELIGCACHDQELGHIGEVVDVLEDGGGYLLVVRQRASRDSSEGVEILVPFVDPMLVEVDTEGKRIDTRLPPGLVEICTSRS